MLARGGSSKPRTKKQATRASAAPPIITTIRMSADAAPSNGPQHFPNQPNPITLTTPDQSKPFEVILQLAASLTRSIILLPSGSLASKEEFDGAESMRHEKVEQEIEQPYAA